MLLLVLLVTRHHAETVLYVSMCVRVCVCVLNTRKCLSFLFPATTSALTRRVLHTPLDERDAAAPWDTKHGVTQRRCLRRHLTQALRHLALITLRHVHLASGGYDLHAGAGKCGRVHNGRDSVVQSRLGG